MPMGVEDAPVVPMLCNGKWITPNATEYSPVYNPSTEEVIARAPLCGPQEVDQAVRAAADAFSDWSKTPALKRAAILFRYRQLLEAHFDALSALVTRENGKTREE